MTVQPPNVYAAHEAHIMDNCSSGEILREVVLSLRNGYRYPMPLHRLRLLGDERYDIAMALINHYRQNGECQEMHELAEKISETYPGEVLKLNSCKPHDTAELCEALAFYDLCQTDKEAGATGAKRDARERLIEAVRELLQQENGLKLLFAVPHSTSGIGKTVLKADI